jgi:Tfp pilus assembly protein PilO
MQKLTLDKRTIIYIGCALVLLIDLVFIIPLQIRTVVRLRSNIGALKKTIKDYEQDTANLTQLKNERDMITNIHIPGYIGRIIKPQEIFMLTDYISRKAKENNIEILEIITKEPKVLKKISDGSFFSRPIEVNLKGRFHDVATLLNALEQGSYFLETKELAIKEVGVSSVHTFRMVVYAIQQE